MCQVIYAFTVLVQQCLSLSADTLHLENQYRLLLFLEVCFQLLLSLREQPRLRKNIVVVGPHLFHFLERALRQELCIVEQL